MKNKNKYNLLNEQLNFYKKLDIDNYASIEKKLLKIQSLLDDGILKNEMFQYFENDTLNSDFFYLTLMRKSYISEYGFFLMNENFLNIASETLQNKKILEVGAGNGFLNKCLTSINLNITSIDKHIENNPYGFERNFNNVIKAEAIDFLKKHSTNYDLIIMSWPNYDNDFAYNVLLNMRETQKLLYIGEEFGGCTANDKFFDLLESKAIIDTNLTKKFIPANFSWPGIHDKITIFDIKK